MDKSYDVVVIGGGAAGLNGALMLARSRRSVLVVDAGEPRNAPADGVHGMLGHDGVPPGELYARGREEVRRYGGEIVTGRVTAATREGDLFRVSLEDGSSATARRLLVTTGLVDELPDVPGVEERWGHDVIHCPYCHGYEVRDRPIGVLATNANVMHQALLFRQLSHDVVVFVHGMELTGEQREQLLALAIGTVDGEVDRLVVEDDRLTGVRLKDGRVVPREVLVVATRMVARAGFLEGLGLATVPHPSGFGMHVAVDPMTFRTEVPGVWAAGNVADLSAQVGASAAAGATAGAQINADLVMEGARRAVEDCRPTPVPA
ncbi:MAG: NAD(P)/FAD-dependent oxidoreductase [Nocardioides sp.]